MSLARRAAISTVTAAASSYLLTDLATVKAELGIESKKFDADLKRYVKAASTAAAQYCNRVFPVESLKDEFWPARDSWPISSPGGVQVLQLTRWPVVTVATVTEDGTALVEGTDFRVDSKLGQLYRLGTTDSYPRPWPRVAIAVEYSAGYAELPDDLVDAVVKLVKTRWFSRGRDPMLMSETVTGIREARWWVPNGDQAANIPPDIAGDLENYRVPVIG